MAATEVLEAMAAGEGQPARVLDALKRLYGLTDQQIAEAMGMANAQDIQARRKGRRGITPGQLAGFAALFRLEVDMFYRPVREVRFEILKRDPDLTVWAAWGSNPEPTG